MSFPYVNNVLFILSSFANFFNFCEFYIIKCYTLYRFDSRKMAAVVVVTLSVVFVVSFLLR